MSACALGFFAPGAPQVSAAADWKLIVLGVAQDGGIPHLQCTRGVCADVRAGKRHAEKVASIGVVNSRTGQTVLFDATPDLPAQVHALTGGRPPDRIFLTHAHIGHYTGLMYLGREVIGAKEVPVSGTERMMSFLRANGPWSLLVSNRNISLQTVEPNRAVVVGPGLRVTAFQVPHRDEFTDTVGYRIEGPRATALFVPDTDRWETWKTSIRDLADSADLAFLDGTFASPADVQGRDISEIPHPMMSVTRKLLAGARARLWFIHINHTNPELEAKDVVREGMTFEL
jgi:pyrroloquinoline quinone biosynthesis protein B